MIFNRLKKSLLSFTYAGQGIYELVSKENNARIHLLATVGAVLCGLLLRVSKTEWCILVIVIASVWSAEAMNSAVERTVDLITEERCPLAKSAKDFGAAAVLFHAVSSVVVGCIIFLPKILQLFCNIL